jgi:SAM-dependent methyltransferase
MAVARTRDIRAIVFFSCLPIPASVVLSLVKMPSPSSRPDPEYVNQSSLQRIAHSRLYPPVTDPSYLVLRSRRLIFSRWIKELKGDRLTVLDIGGRYQPYRSLFGEKLGRYIAVDVMKTTMVSVVADGQALPFAPESFDLVIATQVMEYFSEPAVAVKQIHSVLKPGGAFLASVAACAPRFVEEELWRFTRPGLRALLASFAQVEIIPELYSAGSVVRTLNLAMDAFVHYPSARWLYRRTVCPALNAFGLGLEKLRLTSNDQFTANYSVLAVKAK